MKLQNCQACKYDNYCKLKYLHIYLKSFPLDPPKQIQVIYKKLKLKLFSLLFKVTTVFSTVLCQWLQHCANVGIWIQRQKWKEEFFFSLFSEKQLRTSCQNESCSCFIFYPEDNLILIHLVYIRVMIPYCISNGPNILIYNTYFRLS